MKKRPCCAQTFSRQAGYTIIEIMIVLGVIAVILSLALPVYTNYSIRAKVGEALAVVASAKTAVNTTCIEDPTIDPLTESRSGYAFAASKYVASVSFSGTCRAPVITVTTQNTGASTPIDLTLTGNLDGSLSRLDWACTSNTADRNVPKECRN